MFHLSHCFMKKFSLLFSAAFLIAAVGFSSSVQAQSDEYSRLYEEFLKRLQQEQGSETMQPAPTTPTTTTVPPTTTKPTTTTPKPEVKTQPKVKTSMYSVTGKVTRSADGRYFIATDEKPSRTLRVYGQEAAKEIMQAVVYESVQLIGEKAYFNGKEVGISATKVVPLSMKATTTKTTPVKATSAPKPEPKKTPMMQETTFMGEIEVSSSGNPFLVMTEGKKRTTHRLLNSTEWKMAFQHAYKGMVKVKGYMTEAGAIRYSNISK